MVSRIIWINVSLARLQKSQPASWLWLLATTSHSGCWAEVMLDCARVSFIGRRAANITNQAVVLHWYMHNLYCRSNTEYSSKPHDCPTPLLMYRTIPYQTMLHNTILYNSIQVGPPRCSQPKARDDIFLWETGWLDRFPQPAHWWPRSGKTVKKWQMSWIIGQRPTKNVFFRALPKWPLSPSPQFGQVAQFFADIKNYVLGTLS